MRFLAEESMGLSQSLDTGTRPEERQSSPYLRLPIGLRPTEVERTTEHDTRTHAYDSTFLVRILPYGVLPPISRSSYKYSHLRLVFFKR